MVQEREWSETGMQALQWGPQNVWKEPSLKYVPMKWGGAAFFSYSQLKIMRNENEKLYLVKLFFAYVWTQLDQEYFVDPTIFDFGALPYWPSNWESSFHFHLSQMWISWNWTKNKTNYQLWENYLASSRSPLALSLELLRKGFHQRSLKCSFSPDLFWKWAKLFRVCMMATLPNMNTFVVNFGIENDLHLKQIKTL